MFLVAVVILNIILAALVYAYNKLTSGICKCSKHLVGKVAIVTGGNNGIGYETAKDLAYRGARVILGCRDEGRGLTARAKIITATGNQDVHFRHLDLSSLASVRQFAEQTLKIEKRLDILINNAGMYGSSNVKTEDGLLLGMQTNHFGPFLLTCLLLPLLKSTASTSLCSRIINVSSHAYARATLDIDNLNMEKETEKTFNKIKVYALSKLCNVMFTLELSRRLRRTGVTANCLHPGVVSTDILGDVDSKIIRFLLPFVRPFFKNPWEGAQTSIYLAVSPDLSDVSGKYFRDCRMLDVNTEQARDEELARKLWDKSEKFVILR